MKRKKNYLLIPTLIIILSVTSCNKLKKDYSLEPEAYVKLGMPDYKKKWTGDDYSEANITLSTLKMDAPLSLPRKYSKNSGVIFKRFVNEENITFVYDTVIPLKVRAFLIQHYPAIIGEMEFLYTFEYKGKLVYREELLDLKNFELTIHDKMLELAQIINSTDDETLAGFRDGMKMVKYNYIKLIPAILKELSDNEQLKTDEAKNLCIALSESVKTNSELFSAQEKDQLISEFKSRKERIKSSFMIDLMDNCIKELSD